MKEGSLDQPRNDKHGEVDAAGLQRRPDEGPHRAEEKHGPPSDPVANEAVRQATKECTDDDCQAARDGSAICRRSESESRQRTHGKHGALQGAVCEQRRERSLEMRRLEERVRDALVVSGGERQREREAG